MNPATVVAYSLMLYLNQQPLIGPPTGVLAKNIATLSACDDLGKKMLAGPYSGFHYVCLPTVVVTKVQVNVSKDKSK